MICLSFLFEGGFTICPIKKLERVIACVVGISIISIRKVCIVLQFSLSLFNILFIWQIPKKGKIYSVNEGNAKNWDGPTAKCALFILVNSLISLLLVEEFHDISYFRYVEKCKFPKDGSSPKSLRYIGRYCGFLTTIYWDVEIIHLVLSLMTD